MSKFYSVFIGVTYLIYAVQSSITIKSGIPYKCVLNVPYSFVILNLDSKTKFTENYFVLSLELLDPDTESSIGSCAITGSDIPDEHFRGFSVQNYVIKNDNISMTLTFSREAYNKKFVVRYGLEKEENDKLKFFDDKKKGIMYSTMINLNIPYKITMESKPDLGVLQPNDKNKIDFQLIPENFGLITCSAKDGLPKLSPIFTNGNILKGNTITYVNEEIVSLKWKVLLEDHGKNIQCRAGLTVQNISLNVYHYVTKVHSSPQVSNKIARNSQLKCISEDGYPPPKTNWTWISGPVEAYKHYQFRDNNVTLFINNSAPINSNWTFECCGMNDMPAVVQKYLQTQSPTYPIRIIYNFTIIDSNEVVHTSQIGLIIVLIILFTMILVIIVVGVKYRSHIRKLLVNHNSQISKYINSRLSRCWNQLKPRRILKSVKESTDKPSMTVPQCKYSEAIQNESQPNRTEDSSAYSVIVAVVQKKHDPSFGPVDRV